MTNNQLILIEWAKLVQDGKITEQENIHTYAGWKSLGYVVKRGEKAIAKFTIWKHSTRKDGTETIFAKHSAFFASHQVERVVQNEHA